MRLRRQQGQKHRKELQHLLEEINKWKKLAEERVTEVYANVAKKPAWNIQYGRNVAH